MTDKTKSFEKMIQKIEKEKNRLLSKVTEKDEQIEWLKEVLMKGGK